MAVMPPSTPDLAVLERAGSAGADDRDLARRLGVPAVTEAALGPRYLLARGEERLEIRWNEPRGPRPLSVDFVTGPAARRFAAASRRLPLARAIGVSRGTHTVLDATAGLGRDAFALGCLGCRVLLVERSNVIAALLDDGLRRARADAAARARCGDRLELIVGDAKDVMRDLAEDDRPDAVLLDPMLGAAGSARVKKETRLLQELLGPAAEAETAELLALARRTALRRTVVKRPLRAPCLAPDVDARIEGQRVRWDVYLTRGS